MKRKYCLRRDHHILQKKSFPLHILFLILFFVNSFNTWIMVPPILPKNCKRQKINLCGQKFSYFLHAWIEVHSHFMSNRNFSRLRRLIFLFMGYEPILLQNHLQTMYEMYAKFHQNWWCGFWEKRSHKTNFCGFIYRMFHIHVSCLCANLLQTFSNVLDFCKR